MKTDLQISTGKNNDKGKHGVVGNKGIPNPVQGWDISKWCLKGDPGSLSRRMSRSVAEGEVGERIFR